MHCTQSLVVLTAAALVPVSAFQATPLKQRVQALIDASPAARGAFWGIRVLEAETGKVVYARNAEKYFIPASNTKLFSTALALSRLGPDHRFETKIVSRSEIDPSGRLSGDLILAGGGDPTLSPREIPYRKGDVKGDPLVAIAAMADELVARGLRRVDGDVIGDDTAYEWEPYPAGWALDDATWEYGAAVSALVVNDNAFRLSVQPGAAAGEPGRIRLTPPFEFFTVHNHVRTAARGTNGRVRVRRDAGSREIHLAGELSLGSRGTGFVLAVGDPALYAASVLYDALVARGVGIHGRPRARHRWKGDSVAPPEGVVLVSRKSPPLIELARVVDKVSQNLHAELLLLEAGRVRGGEGGREAALGQLEEFLKEIGIPPESYDFADGSGLSRLTRVTPHKITQLLAYMFKSAHRDAWRSLMPVGGEDGTLEHRFDGEPRAKLIQAKTGTISHVSALSGYAESASRGTLIFSILVNNYNSRQAEVRSVIDKISILLTEQ